MSLVAPYEGDTKAPPMRSLSSPAKLEDVHIGCDDPLDEDSVGDADPRSTNSDNINIWPRIRGGIAQYHFPLMIVVAILLARLYPPLGADYLQPEITASWIAVAIIFVLSGMGLKTDELSKAFQRFYFNAFVQIYNFGIVSLVVFSLSRAVKAANILDSALADGMVICSCLPMAINVVIVLTAAAGGDEAASVFNATFGNIVGIFLSPVLILLYLGSSGEISLGNVFYKLVLKVVVPLIVGHVVQKVFRQVRVIFAAKKSLFKKVQELCLVYIIYTVFCRTFDSGAGAGIGNIFLMIFFQLAAMLSLMAFAWYCLRFLFRDEPELRVMGVFGCVQKTVALGVPLITSIYGGDANEGLYTLPILIWHPMQLILGSVLVPYLAAFIHDERIRLDQVEIDNGADVEEQPVASTSECAA